MTGVEPVLDAHVVLRWCRAALAGLADAREEIDALNVYPVPDGDTGTNLYLTLESATLAAEQVCADAPSPQMGPVLQAVARGALLGARGNSGVILSQMLRGVAEVLGNGDDSRPEPVAFADALVRAADAGYAAVADPVEGTILSVARAAADAARTSAAADDATLPHVALVAARAAREALARTPDQLEILRRSGVVDAGGRGLTVVLDAFDTVLTGRRQLAYPRPVGGHLVPAVAATEPIAQSPAYEVMYLLEAPDDTVPALKAALEPLGDSLIVVGGAPLWNVHVHVDDVGAAIEAGIAAGRPYRIRVTHLAAQTARPATSATGRALVAFAAGDGLAALFESAGAIVVRTPVGRRPSTAEMLEAVRRGAGGEVVILPNERDGIPVAEAAAAEARAEGFRVAVIPTRAQVQGIAATAVHEPARPFDADVVAMTTAAGHTRHGAVTVAAREAATSAGVCRPGDILGVVEGDFALIGSDLLTVAVEVVERMLAAGGELVTLVTGAEAADGLADGVVKAVHDRHPEVDTVVYDGGQPRYPLLLGVE
jgi:uncharacterized protein